MNKHRKVFSEYTRISLYFCVDNMDVETAIQDDYLTSQVLYSILRGIHNGQSTVKANHRGYIFMFHPIVIHYLKEIIWKRNETCCKDNTYKIKMNFSYKDEYQGNEQEEVEFIQLLKNRMPDENGTLLPYLCQQIGLTDKEKVCLLCTQRKGEYMDYDCMNCRADMLMFLQIMHCTSNWIPLGWNQFISHRIPPNPTFSGLHYNMSTVDSILSDVPHNTSCSIY